MKILLNVLGVLIYFLNRFANRRAKDKDFSVVFWLKDNWPEFSVIALVDASLMILLLTNDLTLDMATFLPEWLSNAGDLTLSWLIGLGLSSLIYNIIKKKMKEVKP